MRKATALLQATKPLIYLIVNAHTRVPLSPPFSFLNKNLSLQRAIIIEGRWR